MEIPAAVESDAALLDRYARECKAARGATALMVEKFGLGCPPPEELPECFGTLDTSYGEVLLGWGAYSYTDTSSS